MSSIIYHIDRHPSLFQRIREFADGERVFCLCDSNSYAYCFPILQEILGEDPELVPLVVEPGEAQKGIKTCEILWERLLEERAERSSLFIAWGGGVVTDIGGFVAASYRRGMPFVQIPTTLLGMVDAAIGGKNGVDFAGIKNAIGTVRQPLDVLIHPPFLKTLDERQRRAGYAEMLKHGALDGPELFRKVGRIGYSDEKAMEELLPEIIEVKRRIVETDPEEEGMRAILNFGHTVGHALESLSLRDDTEPLLHGEAVAAGMIVEAFLSERSASLSKEERDELVKIVLDAFGTIQIPPDEEIMEFMGKDKKVWKGEVRFVLLEALGDAVPGWTVTPDAFKEVFQRYRELG